MSEKAEEKSVEVRPARPVRSFRELFEDMDRLWEGFPSLRRMLPLIEAQKWPAVDVFEREGALVVKADTPGMSAKDIEINVNENGLTISGERSEEKEVKEKDYYRSERSYGRFTRQIPLPAGVDREKATANFKDGVLEVTLPLREEAKQKKIEVKAS
jgi:HSP20 family protein